jgi:hypothetical protein
MLKMAGADDLARYLAETGLSVEAAFQAHGLENAPRGPWALERLTPAERRTLQGIERTFDEARGWVVALAVQGATIKRPRGLPAEEAETLTAALKLETLLADPRAVRLEGGGVDVWSSALVISPTLAKLAKRQNALHTKCILSPDELRHRITEHLTRPDGTVAPSPSAWCAARAQILSDTSRGGLERWSGFLHALIEAWLARRNLLREDTHAREPIPLRVGSRAVKTYSQKPGAPWRDTLKRLKTANALSKQELQELEKEEPVPLKGDELLVVAGLLELARREPGFRAFGPTSARVGNYTLEARFLVPKPRLEEFCRLLGYEPTKNGSVSGGDRGKVVRALEALSKTSRPIVVRRLVRNEQQWEDGFVVARDLPVRDDGEHYALHASLFDGFFHGHLTFHRVPQQWDAARRAIGRRNITDEMKWGDVYFRRLALGVLAQTRREFLGKRYAELEADGIGNRVARSRAAAEWREQKPPTMEKRLKTETLLAELNLTEWRNKRGTAATRETLETVLEFARAVEGCPVVAWEWIGTGKLPGKLAVTLETPDASSDPEDGIEQGELFASLGPGEIAAEVVE